MLVAKPASPASIRGIPSWIVLLGFLAAGFLTYFPCLHGLRIWDDDILIGTNPYFRSPVFSLEVFRRHLFSESFSTYYRPFQNLSYMLDYWLYGESTTGYHCTNVLLHALAAWMLFLVLRRLLPSLWKNPAASPAVALPVSLLWLVHPVHNAAVAYISGRADSLAALFALAAWIMWFRAREASTRLARWSCGLLSAILFLTALCSKEIALVWALLFCLHTAFFERPITRRTGIVSGACLAGVIAIYAVLHSLPEHRAAAHGLAPEPFGGRIMLALRALGDYCRLMFAPVQLMMERSLGSSDMYDTRSGWLHGIASEYLSILGAITLLTAAWLCKNRGEGRSLRRFGVLWFLVAFIPISNLIPLNAEVAEHWIYAASVGFLLAVAGAAALLSPRAKRISMACAAIAATALAVRTNIRAADWADGETFARSTIANGGGSLRMMIYYANELGRKGRTGEQERVYRKILAIRPDFAPARINLGISLQKQGRADEARPLLDLGRADRVAPAVPRNWNAALNAAGQMHKEGKSAEALSLVREWMPANPDTWELVGFEANVLHETEGPLPALAAVEKYAAAHWWHLPSQIGLASLQRETGRYAQALATAKKAEWLDIRGASAFDEAAKCELGLGRLPDALEAEGTAVARAPHNPAYLTFFSAILHQMGREDEALAARRKAQALAAVGK